MQFNAPYIPRTFVLLGKKCHREIAQATSLFLVSRGIILYVHAAPQEIVYEICHLLVSFIRLDQFSKKETLYTQHNYTRRYSSQIVVQILRVQQIDDGKLM